MALTDAERDKLIDAAMSQLNSCEPVKLELEPIVAASLISTMQLALRHPQHTGPTSKIADKFVRDLIEQLDPAHGEAYTFLMMGFKPEFDQ